MKLSDILIQEETCDTRRAFLYVEGEMLKAYEFSAYALSRCFDDFRLCEEIDRENNRIILTGSTAMDFLVQHDELEFSVNNDCIELKLPPEGTRQLEEWNLLFKIRFTARKESCDN